jgi:hypothetical protein
MAVCRESARGFRNPPRSLCHSYAMAAPESAPARSPPNCGLRRDPGAVRTSTSRRTPARSRSSMTSSTGRTPCPMVDMRPMSPVPFTETRVKGRTANGRLLDLISGRRREVPSSSGRGHHPLKVETRVQIPLGLRASTSEDAPRARFLAAGVPSVSRHGHRSSPSRLPLRVRRTRHQRVDRVREFACRVVVQPYVSLVDHADAGTAETL